LSCLHCLISTDLSVLSTISPLVLRFALNRFQLIVRKE
ncbi:hypothetical protein VCHENC02_0552B, partial [Vibrio harveyi]